MSGASAHACVVCGHSMRGPVARFRFDCPACGYLCADLPVAIDGGRALDEDGRECALAPLRRANFERVLDRLSRLQQGRAPSLLEVGCGHGWFLDAARARGYAVTGIEPDAAIGASAAARGHRVAIGFFPAALDASARYDVVAFNDVFEHLPQPRAALRDVRQVLRPGGLLAINLPSSRGALYRIADALRALGWRGPHDRLWQLGFPSPHLSYFHPDALARLARAEGFVEIDRAPLPSVSREGLWARLRYDRRSSWPARAITWSCVSLALPLLRHASPDIVLHVFRHDADQRVADTAEAGAGSASVTTATR